MRNSTLSYTLSAISILALLAGCSGGSNAGGSSAFAPSTQGSSAERPASPTLASVSPLGKEKPCVTASTSAQEVPLASAASFAVLGGSTVTSTGLTVLIGDLGVSPGTSITGFGPGVVHGTIYAGGPVAAQAQADLSTAYNNVVARKYSTAVPADIGGTTISPGLYNAPVSLGITGTVTLDGQNNKNSMFIFQIPSTLTAGVSSRVVLINKADACNVFWQVGSSATLNTGSKFKGTIMAAASISVGSGVHTRGRLLTEAGAVTLIDDKVNSDQL
jgi:hypothetical protein